MPGPIHPGLVAALAKLLADYPGIGTIDKIQVLIGAIDALSHSCHLPQRRPDTTSEG